MRNKEKYAKELAELACNEPNIAVSKATGNPINCNTIKCDCCALYKGGIYNDYTCVGALEKWAESEYIEKPVIVISKKDRAFLDYIKEEFKYIIRSRDGALSIYKDQLTTWFRLDCRFDVCFPMIKWLGNEEVWLIEDLKKLEVVEEYE